MEGFDEEQKRRYLNAMHAQQSAIAFEIERLGEANAGSSAKHLRVGMNSALGDQAGLAKLLIEKGLITEQDYLNAIVEGAEREAIRMRDIVRESTGLPNISFG